MRENKVKLTRKYDADFPYYEYITVNGVTFQAQLTTEGDWKGIWNLYCYEDYDKNIWDADYDCFWDGFGSLSQCREAIENYETNNKQTKEIK